jgi:hypothetical protein
MISEIAAVTPHEALSTEFGILNAIGVQAYWSGIIPGPSG